MKKLYNWELASHLAGARERRAFTRAFWRNFGFHPVRSGNRGALVVILEGSAWGLRLNRAGKILEVYLWGTQAKAEERLFNFLKKKK